MRAISELTQMIEGRQSNVAEFAYVKLTIVEQLVEKATKEAYVQGGNVTALALAAPLAIVITYVALKVCGGGWSIYIVITYI